MRWPCARTGLRDDLCFTGFIRYNGEPHRLPSIYHATCYEAPATRSHRIASRFFALAAHYAGRCGGGAGLGDTCAAGGELGADFDWGSGAKAGLRRGEEIGEFKRSWVCGEPRNKFTWGFVACWDGGDGVMPNAKHGYGCRRTHATSRSMCRCFRIEPGSPFPAPFPDLHCMRALSRATITLT